MLHIQTTYTEAMCRVEIVDWDGQVLRSFGLDECEGAPHDARIVRRSTLVGALRSAIPPHLIRYGVSVADVHMHEQGKQFLHLLRIFIDAISPRRPCWYTISGLSHLQDRACLQL